MRLTNHIAAGPIGAAAILWLRRLIRPYAIYQAGGHGGNTWADSVWGSRLFDDAG